MDETLDVHRGVLYYTAGATGPVFCVTEKWIREKLHLTKNPLGMRSARQPYTIRGVGSDYTVTEDDPPPSMHVLGTDAKSTHAVQKLHPLISWVS